MWLNVLLDIALHSVEALGFAITDQAPLRNLRVFLCLVNSSDVTFLNRWATETRTWSFMYGYQKTPFLLFACFLSSIACNVCSGFSVWTISLSLSKMRPRWSYETKNNRKATEKRYKLLMQENILMFIVLKYLLKIQNRNGTEFEK